MPRMTAKLADTYLKLDTCCDGLERLRTEGLVDGYTPEQLVQITACMLMPFATLTMACMSSSNQDRTED